MKRPQKCPQEYNRYVNILIFNPVEPGTTFPSANREAVSCEMQCTDLCMQDSTCTAYLLERGAAVTNGTTAQLYCTTLNNLELTGTVKN